MKRFTCARHVFPPVFRFIWDVGVWGVSLLPFFVLRAVES